MRSSGGNSQHGTSLFVAGCGGAAGVGQMAAVAQDQFAQVSHTVEVEPYWRAV